MELETMTALELAKKIKQRQVSVQDSVKSVFEQIEKKEGKVHAYLDTFKHGMPPHGGLGIGLERLTMQLLGEENVREACLFPRDLNRLEP